MNKNNIKDFEVEYIHDFKMNFDSQPHIYNLDDDLLKEKHEKRIEYMDKISPEIQELIEDKGFMKGLNDKADKVVGEVLFRNSTVTEGYSKKEIYSQNMDEIVKERKVVIKQGISEYFQEKTNEANGHSKPQDVIKEQTKDIEPLQNERKNQL